VLTFTVQALPSYPLRVPYIDFPLSILFLLFQFPCIKNIADNLESGTPYLCHTQYVNSNIVIDILANFFQV
jgi:hypothetical protein